MRGVASELTVGIDIGTSSVKAVAADADGNIVARSRIPHRWFTPSPQRFQHDANAAYDHFVKLYDGVKLPIRMTSRPL